MKFHSNCMLNNRNVPKTLLLYAFCCCVKVLCAQSSNQTVDLNSASSNRLQQSRYDYDDYGRAYGENRDRRRSPQFRPLPPYRQDPVDFYPPGRSNYYEPNSDDYSNLSDQHPPPSPPSSQSSHPSRSIPYDNYDYSASPPEFNERPRPPPSYTRNRNYYHFRRPALSRSPPDVERDRPDYDHEDYGPVSGDRLPETIQKHSSKYISSSSGYYDNEWRPESGPLPPPSTSSQISSSSSDDTTPNSRYANDERTFDLNGVHSERKQNAAPVEEDEMLMSLDEQQKEKPKFRSRTKVKLLDEEMDRSPFNLDDNQKGEEEEEEDRPDRRKKRRPSSKGSNHRHKKILRFKPSNRPKTTDGKDEEDDNEDENQIKDEIPDKKGTSDRHNSSSWHGNVSEKRKKVNKQRHHGNNTKDQWSQDADEDGEDNEEASDDTSNNDDEEESKKDSHLDPHDGDHDHHLHHDHHYHPHHQLLIELLRKRYLDNKKRLQQVRKKQAVNSEEVDLEQKYAALERKLANLIQLLRLRPLNDLDSSLLSSVQGRNLLSNLNLVANSDNHLESSDPLLANLNGIEQRIRALQRLRLHQYLQQKSLENVWTKQMLLAHQLALRMGAGRQSSHVGRIGDLAPVIPLGIRSMPILLQSSKTASHPATPTTATTTPTISQPGLQNFQIGTNLNGQLVTVRKFPVYNPIRTPQIEIGGTLSSFMSGGKQQPSSTRSLMMMKPLYRHQLQLISPRKTSNLFKPANVKLLTPTAPLLSPLSPLAQLPLPLSPPPSSSLPSTSLSDQQRYLARLRLLLQQAAVARHGKSLLPLSRSSFAHRSMQGKQLSFPKQQLYLIASDIHHPLSKNQFTSTNGDRRLLAKDLQQLLQTSSTISLPNNSLKMLKN